MEKRSAESTEAALRAGLIAASIYNTTPGRRGRALRPEDFVRMPPKIVTAKEMEAALDAWASSHNASARG